MKIYSEGLGASLCYIPKGHAWRLRAELNDWGEAVITLETEGFTDQLCNCWEYTRGESRLDCYNVLSFYSSVVQHVYGILAETPVDYIDLEEIKDAIMPEYWDAWRKRGVVDRNHWKHLED